MCVCCVEELKYMQQNLTELMGQNHSSYSWRIQLDRKKKSEDTGFKLHC